MDRERGMRNIRTIWAQPNMRSVTLSKNADSNAFAEMFQGAKRKKRDSENESEMFRGEKKSMPGIYGELQISPVNSGKKGKLLHEALQGEMQMFKMKASGKTLQNIDSENIRP